ncbi:hypothetical protein [Parabacteroides sp.]|uniref:hypothetical protein n=1 Tax=Parabacteroides sp. TaxID=1869337 RepID=UPI0026E0D569|nr:hypothetical protein [Parabacteroides sp.]MDO5430484.1 hypothetical protein [Parabacteroides sp.]
MGEQKRTRVSNNNRSVKTMKMKERLDLLIKLGLEEDEALELLRATFIDGALMGFTMGKFGGDKSVFYKMMESSFDHSLKI